MYIELSHGSNKHDISHVQYIVHCTVAISLLGILEIQLNIKVYYLIHYEIHIFKNVFGSEEAGALYTLMYTV